MFDPKNQRRMGGQATAGTPNPRRHRGEQSIGRNPAATRLSVHVRSDPPDAFGGSYESECRPGGPYGALKRVAAATGIAQAKHARWR